MSAPTAFAASSRISLHCDPRTSVEDQIETPILIFPSAAGAGAAALSAAGAAASAAWTGCWMGMAIGGGVGVIVAVVTPGLHYKAKKGDTIYIQLQEDFSIPNF